jgi:hypothetical protein
MEYVGRILHFGASGARNVDTLFFKLRWARYSFQKKRVGTCYTKPVFFHPAGNHVVHSGWAGV